MGGNIDALLWGANHIKNRWYSAAFKKFVVREYPNDQAFRSAKRGKKFSEEDDHQDEKKDPL